MIFISIKDQTLSYQDKTYSISSAKNGVGEVEGSYCTPLGKFKIAEKIGSNLINTKCQEVFNQLRSRSLCRPVLP